jgi:hypothetical protein
LKPAIDRTFHPTDEGDINMTTADLSQDARRMLEEAGCSEVTVSHVVIGDCLQVTIPLTRRAIAALNRQAFARWVELGQPVREAWPRPGVTLASKEAGVA